MKTYTQEQIEALAKTPAGKAARGMLDSTLSGYTIGSMLGIKEFGHKDITKDEIDLVGALMLGSFYAAYVKTMQRNRHLDNQTVGNLNRACATIARDLEGKAGQALKDMGIEP